MRHGFTCPPSHLRVVDTGSRLQILCSCLGLACQTAELEMDFAWALLF